MTGGEPRCPGWLLCEPNLSEGRDADRMEALADAISLTPDVELVHRSADADHNRMVLAYLGAPTAVIQATRALARAAWTMIDLRSHSGAHPRLGALDVVPFVRGPDCSEAEALVAAGAFAAWAGSCGVPAFLYERSAVDARRASLPDIRRGEFEGLGEKLARREWKPDYGPAAPHQRAGAVVVGARDPLVRFNVNLATPDPEPARRIAARVRGAGGGLPRVRALGFALPSRGLSQVSMNITRHEAAPLAEVYERVAAEARAEGVETAGSEFVGPVPASAVRGLDVSRLEASLSPGQLLDLSAADEEDRPAGA